MLCCWLRPWRKDMKKYPKRRYFFEKSLGCSSNHLIQTLIGLRDGRGATGAGRRRLWGSEVGSTYWVKAYCRRFSPIWKALVRTAWLSLCTSGSSQPSPRSHSQLKKHTSRPSQMRP